MGRRVPLGAKVFTAKRRYTHYRVPAPILFTLNEAAKKLGCTKTRIIEEALIEFFRLHKLEMGFLPLENTAPLVPFASGSMGERAIALLKRELADGPRRSVEIERIAREQGISSSALLRARGPAGVKAYHPAPVHGRQQQWMLRLEQEGSNDQCMEEQRADPGREGNGGGPGHSQSEAPQEKLLQGVPEEQQGPA